MTPEGRVKRAITLFLQSYGDDMYYFMPVQSGYGAPGLDYHCVYKTYAFFIEAKARGEKPTARQQETMARIRAAGGTCFVIDCKENLGAVALWLASKK